MVYNTLTVNLDASEVFDKLRNQTVQVVVRRGETATDKRVYFRDNPNESVVFRRLEPGVAYTVGVYLKSKELGLSVPVLEEDTTIKMKLKY